MENWVFFCLGIRRKQGGVENHGENFLLGPTNFFLPNREEKQWGKTTSVQFYHNALLIFFFQRDLNVLSLSLSHVTWTFSSLSLSLFFFFFSTWPERSFFFFFFQRDLNVLFLFNLKVFFFSTWPDLIFTL